MKIIYFTSRFSEPRSTAAGWRSKQLIDTARGAGKQVELCSTGGTDESKAYWEENGFATHLFAANDPNNKEKIQSLSADLVIFDRFFMEEQFGWLFEKFSPETIRIIDTQDIHAIREYRKEKFNDNKKPSLAHPDLQDKTLQRELASILRSDQSLIISESEVEFLIKLGVPQAKLTYLPLSCNFNESARAYSERNDFVWIGSFRHAPNCDSFRYLQSTIWPAIRKQLPDASLHLYGSYPPQWATEAHRPDKGFYVGGSVDDSTSVLAQAKVSLAPLPYGAGLKGKVLESISVMTPVVTNSVGREGFPFEEIDSIDTKESFVSQAVDLYSNYSSWESFNKITFSKFEDLFSNSAVMNKWIALIDQLEKKSTRRTDLWQSILWSQNFRSSEFMSRWIEEKNKLK